MSSIEGFPVHKWTFHTKRVERKGKSQVLFTLAPFIDVQELRQDEKFKKAVVEELEKIGNEIDIKPFVREYVSGIGNAHEYIRSVICEDVLKWEKQNIPDSKISKIPFLLEISQKLAHVLKGYLSFFPSSMMKYSIWNQKPRK
jgi:hypothetical protein